jgi:hypothetical protein
VAKPAKKRRPPIESWQQQQGFPRRLPTDLLNSRFGQFPRTNCSCDSVKSHRPACWLANGWPTVAAVDEVKKLAPPLAMIDLEHRLFTQVTYFPLAEPIPVCAEMYSAHGTDGQE